MKCELVKEQNNAYFVETLDRESMKRILIIPVLCISGLAKAAGAASSTGDIMAYAMVISFLTAILGLIYLFEFIRRINKDDDYREQLKSNLVSKLTSIKSIFLRGRDDGSHDFSQPRAALIPDKISISG